jgi:hypothetical protein
VQGLKIVPIAVLALTLMMDNASADTQQEIAYLLNFVETTSCKYERNGTIHNGHDARDHINKKHQHYQSKVKTAEDFIRYSATKSMITGRKYKIHCPGHETVYANDWLLTELQVYRSKQDL